jgi:hypothetical protein
VESLDLSKRDLGERHRAFVLSGGFRHLFPRSEPPGKKARRWVKSLQRLEKAVRNDIHGEVKGRLNIRRETRF